MKVGDYNILRKVATGGMAEVFLAEKKGVGGFRRRVILKKLLPKFTEDPSFVEMFYNEAILVSNLNHPNIVQVYDVIRNKFEIYISMEYVDGPGLSVLFRNMLSHNMPIPFPMAARVVADVARALDHAYNARDENGEPMHIIHRDVTPSNIMINKTGVVKLVDFGIAKANFTDDQAFIGYVRGKPAYMAPELFNKRNATHQSDIFSLGVVLFELTTGHRLFKRKDAISTVKSVLRCRIPPPTRLVENYPEALEAIIGKAVTREPDARYTSAADMANELEAYISSTPQKRVDTTSTAEFISEVMTLGSEKGFDEMTIDDFLVPEGVPSITAVPKLPTLTTDSTSSSGHYDNLDDFIASLGTKVSKKGKNYIMWFNGFLVALLAFVAIYFLFLKPGTPKTPVSTKNPVSIAETTPKMPDLRHETKTGAFRVMERRPAWTFFNMPGTKHTKADETGILSMHILPRAKVFIDKKTVGKFTKIEMNLPRGMHRLIIKKKGYITVSRRIRVKKGKKFRLAIKLKPEKSAVTANPVAPTPKPVLKPSPVASVATVAPVKQAIAANPSPVAKKTPAPAKKVPHLGFAMSVIRQVGVILNVLAHDQDKFKTIATVKTAIVCDDDPYSKKKAQAVFAKMRAVSGRNVAGKRIAPEILVYRDTDSLRHDLRAMRIRLVYVVPMDHKDVRGTLKAAIRAGAATVTGIAGYQRVGVCLSVGRKGKAFALVINKRRCKAEGVRFDDKILNLAKVY